MMHRNKDDSKNDLNIVNQDEYPVDSVSSISWAPNSNVPTYANTFACSDWDSKIRLYQVKVEDTEQKGIWQKACFDAEDPCLSVNWSEDCTKVIAGCIRNTVKSFDTETGKSVTVGHHDAGVKDVYWIPNGSDILCSLSFDKTMKFWDLRQQDPVASYNLGLKVFCSDFSAQNGKMTMIIGLQEQKILVVDLQDLANTFNRYQLDYMYINSPLGDQSHITAIGFHGDGTEIGVASEDGRVNLSRIQSDAMGRPMLGNIMTFKAHKIDQSGTQRTTLYPVNAIGFHPKSRYYMFSAGGEGNMFFWDYNHKNKITGFDYEGVPVTRAKMSPDGSLLVYALGYDWARGIQGHMTQGTRICAHIMKDNELTYNR